MYAFQYLGQPLCHQRMLPGAVATQADPYCTNYQEFDFDFNGGGPTTPVVGNWILGATTACAAKIMKITLVGAGTWAGSDAAGTMRVASVHAPTGLVGAKTYFNGTENITILATADDLTMTTMLRPCLDDYPFRHFEAQAMMLTVYAQTALVTLDHSIPDKSQLIGQVLRTTDPPVVFTDANAIRNFKAIDYATAGSIISITYFFA